MRASQAIETRSALVAAARRLFADKGFHGTGTHEIVALAGVSRGALQHHFPRKEELFKAVFEQMQQDFIDRARSEDVYEIGQAWAQLKTNFGSFLEAASQAEVQRIVLIDGPAVLGWAEWRRLEAHYGLGVIERAVEDGIAAGQIPVQPAKPLAHLILAVIEEAALLVANAQDPVAARDEANIALQTLLDLPKIDADER
ncbi:MAG: TetR/AcrR family transcriptional regulator [Methyloceanibacter sp.]